MVKLGYRATDVGVIPEDWDVASIGEFNPFVTSGSRGWAEHYSEFGDPFIRITNMTRDRIYLDQSRLRFVALPKNSAEGKRTQLQSDDILISITADIGICSYVDADLAKPAYINQHIAMVRFDTDEVYPKFVNYFLASDPVQRLFAASSDTGAKAGMNLDGIRSIKFAKPKPEEQKAIAGALSDVDGLITGLEALIAKKRALKTGTMQQLLTGKTRLPGFGVGVGMMQTDHGEIPEDWEVVSLIDACDFLDGQRRPVKSSDRAKMRGQYPYYGASGIVDYVDSYIFDGEFILLGEDGENILSRNLPLAFKVSGKIWVNNHAHVLKPKSEFEISFLTEYLETLDYSLLNSGTAQPKLNKQSCSKVSVIKPSFKEQQAIAEIISDFVNLITKLQANLAKAKALKQGMMQELLTGRTRLI